MPYCQVKNCGPQTAKLAEYTPDFNDMHQKYGVRCPAGHHSWPPTETAPTGHAPFADVAWRDVPESWLLSQVRDCDPENKIARRCRAEWLRRWEERQGCSYAEHLAEQDRRKEYAATMIVHQLPDVASPTLEPPLGVIMPPVEIAGAWATATPREWQRAALPLALAAIADGRRSVVSATMGSGKSILLAEIARCTPTDETGVIVITTPTVRLVDQLAATVATICGEPVGRYYTHAKETGRRIIVCCNASATALAAELARTGKTVALWIGDEIHRSETAQIIAAHAALAPAAAIGFTATPYRSERGGSLSLWTDLAYEYGVADALRDGVIVQPSLVSWTGDEMPLDDACTEMIRNALRHGPGLANATSVADAEGYAATLRRAGVTAAAIHFGLTRPQQADVIESLRTGEIEVLVHVNMLSEGIDLPWLRWLCMRRAVGSKVRFCQEVGRVLRASPGKDCAYLLDPHDLFNVFGLTYEAMLAGGQDAPESAIPEEDQEAQFVLDLGADPPMVKKLSVYRSYIRRLNLAFALAGLIEAKIKSTGWRSDAPSEKQTKNVGWLSKITGTVAEIPTLHRKALRVIGDNFHGLKKGDISDLFGVCMVIRDRRTQKLPWPDLELTAEVAQ